MDHPCFPLAPWNFGESQFWPPWHEPILPSSPRTSNTLTSSSVRLSLLKAFSRGCSFGRSSCSNGRRTCRNRCTSLLQSWLLCFLHGFLKNFRWTMARPVKQMAKHGDLTMVQSPDRQDTSLLISSLVGGRPSLCSAEDIGWLHPAKTLEEYNHLEYHHFCISFKILVEIWGSLITRSNPKFYRHCDVHIRFKIKASSKNCSVPSIEFYNKKGQRSCSPTAVGELQPDPRANTDVRLPNNKGDRAAYSEPSLGFTRFYCRSPFFGFKAPRSFGERIFWGSDCPLAASFLSRCMAAQGNTVHFAAEDEAWTEMLHSTSYGCTFVGIIFMGCNSTLTQTGHSQQYWFVSLSEKRIGWNTSSAVWAYELYIYIFIYSYII